MDPTPALPIVAIVGRPNVGKSTLFNRYAGHRRALVVDSPGVTRDRIAEEVEVAGRRILVVDTAGLDPEPGDAVEAAIQAQALVALDQADAILFLVDGRAGLVPEDEVLAQLLRRTRKPLVVGVNKVDVPAREVDAAEFHALGLEPVMPLSAEHGRGVFEVLEQLVEALPVAPEPAPEADQGLLRVALVGRPNAGKSSLLNRIVGAERVVVSEVPGTTRDTIDIRVTREEGDFVLVDTAGLRRPGRRDRLAEPGSALMTLRAVERAQLALVVVDATEGFTDGDLRIIALVRERGCAAVIVLNKWDLLVRDDDRRDEGSRSHARTGRPGAHHPLVQVSAKTGKGVAKLFPLIGRLGEAAGRRIPTAELNRWLADCVARHEPAMATKGARRRPLKFFYATQTGSYPPRFALFCTDPKAIQPSYRRFLENRLREDFELGGVPLRLSLRPRRASDDAPE